MVLEPTIRSTLISKETKSQCNPHPKLCLFQILSHNFTTQQSLYTYRIGEILSVSHVFINLAVINIPEYFFFKTCLFVYSADCTDERLYVFILIVVHYMYIILVLILMLLDGIRLKPER